MATSSPKFLNINEPAPAPAAPAGFALWALGFRPFYLLAATFAALSVPLWVAQYAGWLPWAPLRSPAWHGHEMLFGYALAVVTGFLFTAVRNWTAQPTPTGGWLAACAALWVAGRILVLTPWGVAAAIVNAAFPLAVAVGIGIPLAKSGNRRNYFFVVLLAAMSVAILLLHLAELGLVAWPERVSLKAGQDVFLFIVAVMGGRVIPMFTNNGVPGTQARRLPLLERVSLGSLLALLAADLLQAHGVVLAMIAGVAAVAHAWRLVLWQPLRTLRTPLVWVLHVAYGWIAVHLLLRALAALEWVVEPLATHALTLGVIGGMTIGMMTRTARGHTGRPLRADRYEVAAYLLVLAAAVARVAGGLALPMFYGGTVVVSGLCWSAGFAVYFVRYWPVLTRPRLDGKPG